MNSSVNTSLTPSFPPPPADEDKTGPVVLSALLGLAIVINFAVNLLGTKPVKA